MSTFESRVHSTTQLYLEALNKGDLKTLLGLYAPDALVLPAYGSPVTGQTAIGDFLKSMLQDGRPQAIMKNTQIQSSGDLAVETGEYAMHVGADDKAQRRESGNFIITYEKQADGELRITTEIWSSDASRP